MEEEGAAHHFQERKDASLSRLFQFIYHSYYLSQQLYSYLYRVISPNSILAFSDVVNKIKLSTAGIVTDEISC